MVELSVVVPTYNERDNIPSLIERLNKLPIDLEIIIVDDNSPDGTADVAEELNKKYGNIRILRRPGKMGLGSAVMDGVKIAGSEIIAVMDADLQHPPEIITKMFEFVRNGFDIAIASRYVDGGVVEGLNLIRKLISKVATILAHVFIKRSRLVKDPMSGFFMFKKSVIDGVQLNPVGYKVLLEILAKGKYSSVVEIPYTFKSRDKGKSKLGLREIARYLKHIMVLSEYKPIKFVLVGTSGIFVNLGLLYVLVQLLRLPVSIAGALAIEASIIWNFNLNDIWTFKGCRSGNKLIRLIKYHLAVAVGALINYAILIILTSFFGINYLLSGLIGILLSFVVRYIFSQEVVWSD